jgi:hypothetical protein
MNIFLFLKIKKNNIAIIKQYHTISIYHINDIDTTILELGLGHPPLA